MHKFHGGAAACLIGIFLYAAALVAAERTAAKPDELTIPRPTGNLNLKIGHPSSIAVYDVPSEMTHERLNKEGWKIESVTFTRTDLNIQALTQGTVQMSVALSIDPLRAIEKGGKIKWLMEN